MMPEGLTCFGNPTLETLNLKNKLPLPTIDFQIQSARKTKSGVSNSGGQNRIRRKQISSKFATKIWSKLEERAQPEQSPHYETISALFSPS